MTHAQLSRVTRRCENGPAGHTPAGASALRPLSTRLRAPHCLTQKEARPRGVQLDLLPPSLPSIRVRGRVGGLTQHPVTQPPPPSPQGEHPGGHPRAAGRAGSCPGAASCAHFPAPGQASCGGCSQLRRGGGSVLGPSSPPQPPRVAGQLCCEPRGPEPPQQPPTPSGASAAQNSPRDVSELGAVLSINHNYLIRKIRNSSSEI